MTQRNIDHKSFPLRRISNVNLQFLNRSKQMLSPAAALYRIGWSERYADKCMTLSRFGEKLDLLLLSLCGDAAFKLSARQGGTYVGS